MKTFFIFFFSFFFVSSVFASDLKTISKDIENNYIKSQSNQQITLDQIAKKRAELKAKLARLSSQVIVSQNELKVRNTKIDELKKERQAIQNEISSRLANKEELDAIFMNSARNLLARVEKSPRSAKEVGILPVLQTFSQKNHSFGMADIESLLRLHLNDMNTGRQHEKWSGEMLARTGETFPAEVLFLGHMFSIYKSENGVGYGLFSPVSSRLVASAKPSFLVRHAISNYFSGGQKIYADISGGESVSQLAQKTTLADQIRSGGVLVIPIAIVGIIALVLIIERIIFLGKVRQNTDKMMTEVTRQVQQGHFEKALAIARPYEKRPTGGVLMAGLLHADQPGEILENCISEAILRQTPRLERFLNALKVLAAVSTLLGLLGTVTGMINTFQVITVHGTGDPRLMAGGISEAMVTTQVGLAVAIPVMMMAAFLSGRARRISLDMEEKGLSLIAALLQRKQDMQVPN